MTLRGGLVGLNIEEPAGQLHVKGNDTTDQIIIENTSEWTSIVANEKDSTIKELSPARIHHAEDLIFWEGSAGAMRAVQQLEQLAKGTQSLTIKWDGSPAVVFGRNPNGEFIFTDKHGFMAKSYDGRATNPEDLERCNHAESKRQKQTKSYRAYASKMKSVFEIFQKRSAGNIPRLLCWRYAILHNS